MTDQEFENIFGNYKPFWYWLFYRKLHPLPKGICIIVIHWDLFLGFIYDLILINIKGTNIYRNTPYVAQIYKGYLKPPEEPFRHHAERSPLIGFKKPGVKPV